MALSPRYAGAKLPSPGAGPRHTLELYLDYVCPFSAKLFNTFYTSVSPLIAQKYSQNLQVIFRNQVQPWHPTSTLVHEAGVAVLQLAPEKFWPFSEALFKNQKTFFDESCVNETRNETYKRLAGISEGVGVDKDKMMALLKVGEKKVNEASNSGNEVTDDLKKIIKANRVVGVHMSPTVFFDGVEEKSLGSSSTADQWKEWLQNNVG